MSNNNMNNKKPKITINTIIIAVLLITISVLTYRLILINDLYNALIDNQKNINDEIENNEITKNNEIENTKENKFEDEIGDNYYYFSILDENNNILYKTNYFNNDNIFSSKLLPKKMVFHLIEGDNEYTSSFNNGDVKEKVVTNVVKDVITDVITEVVTKTETVNITTDATVTYIGVGNTTQTINIPSGTTINFNAGEHGLYDSVPSSMTLDDKQQLDITDTIYVPNKIEVNYKFDGFSYSGNTFYANYSYLGNTYNINIKKTQNYYSDSNNKIYFPLEYIECTGTQYINTNIEISESSLKQNLSIEVDCAFTDSILTTNQATGKNQGNYFFFGANLSGVFYSGIGRDYTNSSKNCDTNFHKHKLEAINNKGKYYIDNNVVYDYGTLPYALSEYVGYFHLGNVWTPAGGNLYVMKGKYKSLTCYYKNELFKDLIPVERICDNVLGMYDLKSCDFLTNSGTGTFKGESLLEYDQSAGKIFVSSINGNQLTLVANNNNGFEFVCWNDGTTDNPKTITYNSSDSYYAIFKPIS